MDKIKSIIIFLGVAAVIFMVYYLFFKKEPEPESLISFPSTSATAVPSVNGTTAPAQDFLTLLLSVKSIQLNDAIFSDAAFASLDASHSIVLVGDGSEGRLNPFAPLGADTISIGGGVSGL